MIENKSIEIRKAGVSAIINAPDVKKRFDEVLGKRAPGFISSVISCVNGSAALKKCDPISVISSAMVAAALDLPVTPGLGFAHIVPYKGVATFQIGWKGIVQLALRSGQYKTINLVKVHEGELKKVNRFTGEMDFQDSRTSEKVTGYLLYFSLLNGYEKYFHMTVAECHAHGKKYSQSYNNEKGKWRLDFDAMALKTVAKMGLSKYGVLSVEMQRAIEVDYAVVDEAGAIIGFPDGTTIDVDDESVTDRLQAAAAALTDEEKAGIVEEERKAAEKSGQV